MTAAFGTYFCMYGFRKPFTAAGFEELSLWGIGYKTVLVSAQVFGYMLSKFLGIKVIAEIAPNRRAFGILVLVALSQAALLGFGLTPAPYNAIFLFLNGLPLGMVFGMVLGALEGRALTELLAAGLCASFIVADGFTKSVGGWLLAAGVSESWMPFTAGLVFLLPLVVFVAMLGCLPPPSERDVAARSERQPMTAADRREFFLRYAVGLTGIMAMYLSVTILRSIRADFAREIWQSLGYADRPGVFTTSEMIVGFSVMALTALGVLIRNNRLAFFVAMGMSLAGLLLIPVAILGRRWGLDGFVFMVLIGLGLYLPYVAVHTSIFERLIAMTRDRGNIGFLMYLADSFGYLGYVAVMIGHSAFLSAGGGDEVKENFLHFFEPACWIISAAGGVCLLVAWIYFARRVVTETVTCEEPAPAAGTA
ncbi:MAG: hypothetical protein JSS27_18635 [Planctomycetes bacterium]|nr:hypothetical protein [Planctomycetota bacterium]